jgi:phage tail protein X
MAANTITVQQPFERIDRLAKRLYGTERKGTVEALLNANQGLAEQGLNISGGTKITVPDVKLTEPSTILRPWE